MSASSTTVCDPSCQTQATATVTAGGLITVLCNVTLAACFAMFGVAHWNSFVRFGRPSVLLQMVKELLDALFFLIRRDARKASRSPYEWLIAFGGTFWPLWFRPVNAEHDAWAGQVIQFGGALLTIAAILSLNRSFGIVPANRGVRTGGLYRVVRHPLYMSYTMVHLGYVMNHPSASNLCVFGATTLFAVLRIYREERFLLEDESYREYARRTRWRLAPFVF
ncbi:MAG: isoprenylcysteine carboxylmethyltransferase family protein [Phycisphaerae bacterium]|nr:isoprenylcysteine carboxylmethyltransferase family protein [Phycisphaerae bacterium]NUQ47696.1 isoprenylcysteine carboxylmethyltransferase family protein [Phycisphaerae bacterium]